MTTETVISFQGRTLQSRITHAACFEHCKPWQLFAGLASFAFRQATRSMVRMTNTLAFQFPDRPFEGSWPESANGAAVALRRGGEVIWRGAREGKRKLKSPMTITHEQREAFARLLREGKQRRQKVFEHQLEEKVNEEFLPKLVQRQGITGLVGKIGKLSSELTESAHALQSVDVVGRADNFWSRLIKPEDVNEVLERMKRPYQEQHEESMREYDLAALRIMSADTVEEARQIVESLI